ncbi:LAMI_0A03092g1_1 [Lachancea mirantina]|uniref:LAMI_0A03092g1_1 n=1 Tax=Lachancea mirantina TaxID=1230905 RepID=A0A1G4IMW9_9SACH|nr:LAMI_0A03092g1_1 [Lachancea mirantina]
MNSACRALVVLLCALFYVSPVLADLRITEPQAGAAFTATPSGLELRVAWVDAGGSPELAKVREYTIVLCTGPNSKIKAVSKLGTVPASQVRDGSLTLNVATSAGTDGSYFLQIVAAAPDGYSIHYSDRFTLRGMTGTEDARQAADVDSPSPETMMFDNGYPPEINSASFQVTYTAQTGSWRFAPMQTQPGSRVTATTWQRQHATSAVSPFTTIMGKPNRVKTVTAGWDYTIVSLHNHAKPAPFPAENGGWYNAKGRQTLTTKKVNAN